MRTVKVTIEVQAPPEMDDQEVCHLIGRLIDAGHQEALDSEEVAEPGEEDPDIELVQKLQIGDPKIAKKK